MSLWGSFGVVLKNWGGEVLGQADQWRVPQSGRRRLLSSSHTVPQPGAGQSLPSLAGLLASATGTWLCLPGK